MVGDKTDAKLTLNRMRMISEVRNNPNITSGQLANILGISMTAVEKNIGFLKDNGYIERIGPNKKGIGKSRIDSFKMDAERQMLSSLRRCFGKGVNNFL